MYPTPAFLMCIAEIVPAALTIAVAAADTVDIPFCAVNVIVGDVVYPEPPELIVTIPITPFSILEVAATPAPSPITSTLGLLVYPKPGLTISTN